MFPTHRLRRNRKSEAIRDMLAETNVSLNNLIYPIFITYGANKTEAIPSMPGIYRYSVDVLLHEIETCTKLGIKSFCFFPHIPDSQKDKYASESMNGDGLYLKALKSIRERFKDIVIMSDVAMDPYSSDGHDGLVQNGEINNDATLEILGKMALAQAQTGVDLIGPSDMMDGRVGHIRQLLDHHGYSHTSIIAYTAKYASAFYGPFRDALQSAPKLGDKKTYQLNPANVREALAEAQHDVDEGADMIMVKPAMPYLDIVAKLRQMCRVPIAAYQVSGEYTMLISAAQHGWLNLDNSLCESLLGIKRAGADVILTYFAKYFAQKFGKSL